LHTWKKLNFSHHYPIVEPDEVDELVKDQGVVCVVGLDPNFAPALKVFDAASLKGVRKFENLCRVCLNTTEIMTPIFDDLDSASWVDKIHKHLSIQVRIHFKNLSICV
jgi:hypothetical protein